MPIVKRSRRRITRRCSERETAASRSLPPRHVFYLSIPSRRRDERRIADARLASRISIRRVYRRARDTTRLSQHYFPFRY